MRVRKRPLPADLSRRMSLVVECAAEPEVLRLLALSPDHEVFDHQLPGWRRVLKRHIDDYLSGTFTGSGSLPNVRLKRGRRR